MHRICRVFARTYVLLSEFVGGIVLPYTKVNQAVPVFILLLVAGWFVEIHMHRQIMCVLVGKFTSYDN